MNLYRPRSTMIDFPGVLGLVVFTRGCNLRCPVCHNPSLVLPDKYNNDEQAFTVDEVIELAREQWADGICITGGEPTIHSDIVDVLSELQGAGFKMKLDTNGVDPMMRIESVLKAAAADYIAMDVKAPLDARMGSVTGKPGCDKYVEVSMHLIHESDIQHHFRTTCFEGFLSPNDVEDIAKALPPDCEYILHPFDPHDTLDENLKSQLPSSTMYMRECLKLAKQHVPNTKILGE